MKLKKIKSVKYKYIIYIFIFIVIVASIYYLLSSIFKISRSTATDIPLQTIVVNKSLSVQVDFNNEVEKKGAVEKFVKSIENAKYTVEIAVFAFNSNRIRKALFDADRRGVAVTVILDKSRPTQNELAFMNSPETMKILNRGNDDKEHSQNSFYMHHKFMIIDRNHENAELTTGSLNFTDVGEMYNQSYIVTTNDSEIISIYGKEFDLLKSGKTGVNKLSSREYDPWSANIKYTDSYAEIWMAPGFSTRSVKYRILQLIKSATSSIDIMIWYLTDGEITKALIKKSEDGVKVRAITEDTNATSTDSLIPMLITEKAGKNLTNLEIIFDTKSKLLVTEKVPDGFNPYLHEHAMIIDKTTIIFGTNNWSMWGFNHNDEDIWITNNSYLVNEFQKTFDYFYRIYK